MVWMMHNVILTFYMFFIIQGLATIPVSAFYSPEHRKDFQNYIRFCFVKEDSTLNAAEDILRKWSDLK